MIDLLDRQKNKLIGLNQFIFGHYYSIKQNIFNSFINIVKFVSNNQKLTNSKKWCLNSKEVSNNTK